MYNNNIYPMLQREGWRTILNKLNAKQKKVLSIIVAVFFIGVVSLTLAGQLLSQQITQQITLSGLEGSINLTMEVSFGSTPVFQSGEKVGLLKIERINPALTDCVFVMEWRHENSSVVLTEDMFDLSSPWDLEAWLTGYDENMTAIITPMNFDSSITFPLGGIRILSTLTFNSEDVYYYQIGFDFTALAPLGIYNIYFEIQEV